MLETVKGPLRDRKVDQIVIALTNDISGEMLEQFVFAFGESEHMKSNMKHSFKLKELQDYLKAMLLRLLIAEEKIPPLKEGMFIYFTVCFAFSFPLCIDCQ
jgi:hypothetical protein